MTEERIARELETIRVLLTLDKREELQSYLHDLDEVHELILDEVPDDGWSSGVASAVAEEVDPSRRSVQRKVSELVDLQFLVKRGEGRGTEYRKTGLARAVQLVD